MKNYHFITLLFISALTQAQIVDIPDANFKNALVNNFCVDTDGDGIYDDNADLNNDGEIQLSEAITVFRLRVSIQHILSLEGIQSFTNLQALTCHNNQLTSLDMTQNSNLELLDVSYNFLTNLDVSQNPNLQVLTCHNNQLTNLDVSQNLNLQVLRCNKNELTSLDMTQNSNLELLYTTHNFLTNLDVSQNPNLQVLSCYRNQLTSLDMPQNSDLERLYTSYNFLTNLDVSQNPNLETISCVSNQLTSLDVSQNLILKQLSFDFNQLTDLDVSQNLILEGLYFDYNQLTNLDVSQNLILEDLSCNNNQLTDLDVSQNSDLDYLDCRNNRLTSLNLQNGNNHNMSIMFATFNPNLSCIQVDDETATHPPCNKFNNSGWCKSEGIYSENCFLTTEDFSHLSFTLYPNPTQDILNIVSQDFFESIYIYSIDGSFVKESPKTPINVSELSKGFYFVQINIGNSHVIKKFVKF